MKEKLLQLIVVILCVATLSPAQVKIQQYRAGLIQSNLIAEYRFDEGSGQQINNRVFTPAAYVNLLGIAAERNFNPSGRYWTRQSIASITDDFAANPLDATSTASRITTTTGASKFIFRNFSNLTNGAQYTLSLYVKSNTGSDQTFRMSYDFATTVTKTATTAAWTRETLTFTFTTGTRQIIPLLCNAAGDAVDILVYGIKLEAGATATAYVPIDHADNFAMTTGTWPAWGSGYLNFTGAQHAAGMWQTSKSVTTVSMYALARWNSGQTPFLASYAPLIGEDYTNNILFLGMADLSNEYPYFRFGGSGSLVANLVQTKDTTWHVLSATYDGTTMRMYLDDTEVAISTASRSAQTVQRIFIATANNAAYFPGDIAYLAVYDTGHSAGQVAQNYAALKAVGASRSLTVSDLTKFVYAEGDSITANLLSYAAVGLRAVSPIVQGRSFAVGGSTLAIMSLRSASVDAAFKAARTKNILSVLIGANDLGTINGNTYFTSVKAYCVARKAANPDLKIVMVTVLPQSNATVNTNRGLFNTAVRNDPSFYDALADFAADATVGTDAAGSDTGLYPDGLHPTDAVHDTYLKPIWKAAVESLL